MTESLNDDWITPAAAADDGDDWITTAEPASALASVSAEAPAAPRQNRNALGASRNVVPPTELPDPRQQQLMRMDPVEMSIGPDYGQMASTGGRRIDTLQARTPDGREASTVRLPVPQALAEPQAPPEFQDPRDYTRPVRRDYASLTPGQRAGDQLRSGTETLKQGLTSMGLGSVYGEMEALDRLDRGEAPATNDPRRPVPIADMPPERRAQYRTSLEATAGRKIAEIITSRNRQGQLAANPAAQAITEAGNQGRWGDAWRIFLSDPGGVIQQFAVESAPVSAAMMVPGMGAGLIAGRAAGTIASFLGSYGSEFGPGQVQAVMEALQARGVDVDDERAVLGYLRTDPTLAVEAAAAAGRGAFGPAIFDAMSFGALGFRPGAGFLSNAGRVAGTTALELAGEPAGAALGQVLADGSVTKPGELIGELLGAGPQVVGSTAYGTLMDMREGRGSPLAGVTAGGPAGAGAPPAGMGDVDPNRVAAAAQNAAPPPGAPPAPMWNPSGETVRGPDTGPDGMPLVQTPPVHLSPGAPPAPPPAAGPAAPPAPPVHVNPGAADLEAALADPRPAAEIDAERQRQAAEAVAQAQAVLPPGWQVEQQGDQFFLLDPNGDWQEQINSPPNAEQAQQWRAMAEAGNATGQYNDAIRDGDGTKAAPVAAVRPGDVDAAATQAAPAPTPAQAQAGNYQHGHLRLHGIDIAIETERGGERTGVDPNGQPWSVRMPAHYGRVKRTTGADGDQVDVYLGPDAENPNAPVFIIDQVDADTGRFDEHKVIMGANSLEEAQRLYHAAFNDARGPERMGAITQTTIAAFKAWLPIAGNEPLNAAQISKGIRDRRAAQAQQKKAEADAQAAQVEGRKREASLLQRVRAAASRMRQLGRADRAKTILQNVHEARQNGTFSESLVEMIEQGLQGAEQVAKLKEDQTKRDDARAKIGAAFLAWFTKAKPGDQIMLSDGLTYEVAGDLLFLLDAAGSPARTAYRGGPVDGSAFVVGQELIAGTAKIETKVERKAAEAAEQARRKELEEQQQRLEDERQKAAAEAATPAKKEPPQRPGFIRVYHSGIRGDGTFGRWVSTSRTYASDYRPEKPLYFLDLPDSDPRVNSEIPEQGVKQGFTFNFELTPEEAVKLAKIERASPPSQPAAPAAAPEADGLIGQSWDAPGGRRVVEGIMDTPRGPLYMVREGDSRTVDLLDAGQVRRSREVDEANVKSRAEAKKKADEDAAVEAAAKAEREDVDGFDAGLTPIQRGRVLGALSQQVRNNGRTISRRDLIREKVQAGAMMETRPDGSRRLLFGGNAHFDVEAITKTGMDYAEHLIQRRDGDAAPKPAKPKAAAASEATEETRHVASAEELAQALRDGAIAVTPSGTIYALMPPPPAAANDWWVTYAGEGPHGSGTLEAAKGAPGWSKEQAIAAAVRHSRGERAPTTPKPAEAPEPTGEYGTPANPKMVPLAEAFRDAFMGGQKFASIVQARAFAARLLGGAIEPNSVAAKAIDEAIEGGVVLAARKIVQRNMRAGLSHRETYDNLVDLYARQPMLSVRTGSSRERQAYSTPAPLAYLAAFIAAAGRDPAGMSWIEPTAGTGQLLVLADPNKVDVGEIDDARAEFLIQGLNIPPSAVQIGDATRVVWTKTDADAVIANPPFGVVREDGTGPEKRFTGPDGFVSTHIDHAIAARALEGMAEDGTAVLIVGAPVKDDSSDQQRSDAYRADHNRGFWKWLLANYNVVDHFTVAGALYQRQGAAWPVDVIVIGGRRPSEGRKFPSANLPPVFTTWDEVKDGLRIAQRLEGVRQPPAGTGNSDVGAEGGGQPPGGAAAAPAPAAGTNQPGGRPIADGGPGAGNGESDAAGAGAGSPGGATAGGRPDGAGGSPVGSGGGAGAADGPGNVRPPGGRLGRPDVAADGQPGDGGSGTPGGGNGPADVAAPGDAAGAGGGVEAEASAAVDAAIEALFGKQPKPAAPAPKSEPAAIAPPATPKAPRPAPQAAASAAANAFSGAGDALAGLANLFGAGSNRLSMGFGWDEDTWQKAKPFFREAGRSFAAAASDMGEFAMSLIKALRDAYNFGVEQIMRMKPYLDRFVADVKKGEIRLEDEAAAEEKAPAEPAAAPERKDNEEVETDLQVRYEPSSAANAVGTLVPANMADPMREALAKLRDKVGDLDSFVAERLGYTLEQVRGSAEKDGYFSAEQIDAISLAIDNLDQGAGFIIGDQTGVGKGRFVAAMIRYAMRENRVPVFMTKDPGLYADMYRDLNDIGMGEFSAFVTNNDLKGKSAIPLPARREFGEEEDGVRSLSTPPPATHRAAISKMIETGDMAEGFDAIFTTYSQVQRVKKQETQRHLLLRAIAPNAMFILDESHEAGGSETPTFDPDTGAIIPTRADFIREIITSSHSAVYSSATWAKAPHVVTLYSKTDMGLLVDQPKDLPELLKLGGVPLQQIISNMLVSAGQYVRRERSFDGVAINLQQVGTDAATAGRLALVLRTAFMADDLMEAVREAAAAEIAGDTGNDAAQDNAVGSMSISGTGFASLMHNIINQGLLSLKTEETITAVIAAVRRGEKPVIALSNTMGAFLADYATDNGLVLGSPMDDFTFNKMILRYIERMRRLTIKPPRGSNEEPRHVMITEEQIRKYGGEDALAAFLEARNLATTTDLGSMTASPIDLIVARLQEAGISVGEITGRQRTLEYRDGKPYLAGRETGSAAKKQAMNAFNRGDLDALILNRSGSTGFSLHSSSKFKDQRQRHMFLLQPEPDINIFMQILGRIHRTGQVNLPIYSLVVSDMPIEKRPAALTMKKLGSLNANTTANKDSAFSMDGVVDFLNEYGDQVVDQLLRDDPELSDIIGIGPSIDGEPKPGLAARATGRFGLLDPPQQAEAYARVEKQYVELIDTLDRLGQNTLSAKTLDLDAKTLGTTELVPRKEGVDSRFGDPAVMERMDVKRLGAPMALDEVAEKVEENAEKNSKANEWRETIQRETSAEITEISAKMDTIQKEMDERSAELAGMDKDDEGYGELVRAVEKMEARIDTLRRKTESIKANREYLADLLNKWMVGDFVGVRSGKESSLDSVEGRIIDMNWSKAAKSASALSNLTYRIAIADAAREVTITAAGLRSEKFGLNNAAKDAVEKEWTNRASTSRETRYILTGNIPRALNALATFRGSKPIVVFRRADGTLHSGVLLSRNFTPEAALADMPVRFTSSEQVMEFIKQTKNRGMVETDDGIMSVQMLADGRTFFRVKTRNGKPYLLNKAVRALLVGGDFVGRRGRPESEGATWSEADAVKILDIYAENLGTTFLTKSNKDVARNITGQAEMTEQTEPGASPAPGGGVTLNAGLPFSPENFRRFMLDPAQAGLRAAAAKVAEITRRAVDAVMQRQRDPNIQVVEKEGNRGITPFLSLLRLPNRMFRKFPSLAALVDMGIGAEERMSIWTRRMGGRLDTILSTLKHAKGSLPAVQGALLAADANEVNLEDDATASAFYAEQGLNEAEARAAAAINRLLVKTARLVDQHRRAMLPKVRQRKAKIWAAMLGLMNNARVAGPEYAQAYRRRAYLNRRIRDGKGDLAAQGQEVAEITERLKEMRAADPDNQEKMADLRAEYDQLESRLQQTSVRRRTGYFPHKFFGSWRLFEITDEVDEDGNPIRREITSDQGFYDTQGEAIAAAKAHLKENPGAKLRVEPKVTTFPGGQGGAVLSDAAYSKLRRDLEKEAGIEGDDLNDLLKGVAQRRSRRRVFSAALERKGAAGFSRDIERVMRTHLAQAVRYVELDKLKFAYVSTMEREGLSPARARQVESEGRSEVMRTMEAWFRDVNGNKQQAESMLDHMLEKMGLRNTTIAAFGAGFLAAGAFGNPVVGGAMGLYLGYRGFRAMGGTIGSQQAKAGDFPVRTLVGDITSDLAILKLGVLNIASAVVNMTQTAVNTYPVLGAKWTGVGMRRAMMALASQATNGMRQGVESADATLLRRADIVSRYQASADNPVLVHGQGWGDRLKAIAMAPFESVERFNRATAFLGAYAKAEAEGASPGKAVEAGKAVMRRTQFHQGNANKPELLRQQLLRLPLQFKNFMLQELGFVMGLRGAEILRFGVMVFLVAGLLGFPGMQLLDWLIQALAGVSPVEALRRLVLEAGAEGGLAGSMIDVLGRGLPALLDVDISSRVGLGAGFLPDSGSDFYGPAVGTVKALREVAANSGGLVDYLTALGPFGNVPKALEAAANGSSITSSRFWTGGVFGDGQSRMTNPRKRDQTEYRPTNGELARYGAGFRPLSQSLQADQRAIQLRETREKTERENRVLARVIQARWDGKQDQIAEILAEGRRNGVILAPRRVREAIADSERTRAQRDVQRAPRVLRPAIIERQRAIEGR